MCESLESLVDSLQRVVSKSCVPESSREESVRHIELFERLGRIAAAGRLDAIRGVEKTRAWQEAGYKSMAHWLAAKTGTTLGHAIGAVQAGRALAELPNTQERLASGRLSVQQASEIALAAQANPASEQMLLDASQKESTSELRERCQMIRIAAAGEEGYKRLRSSRYLREWIDRDGAVRLDGRFAPDDIAPFLARVRADADRLAAAARDADTREPWEAHAADALCTLATGEAARTKTVVNVHVDLSAWENGSTRPGEHCLIAGVGPISVAAARRMAAAPGGILKLIGHEGADVTRVVNIGRYIPAAVASAVEARDKRCAVPNCTSQRRLQKDHQTDFSKGGETSVANLELLCEWHHMLKTHFGWRLEGKAGDWQFLPPNRDDRDTHSGKPPP